MTNMTPAVWEVGGSGRSQQNGYRNGDLWSYDTPVWEVSGSCPGCQTGYRDGDL